MTGISTLGQALNQISRLQTQQIMLEDLQRQIGTGKKSVYYKGLGTDVTVSEKSRAEFNKIDSYLSNITRADTRINQMLTALDEITNQTNFVLDSLVSQPQQGDVDLSTIKKIASSAFDYIISMLNTKDGDAFLFAGGDSINPLIKNTGSLDTFFSTINPLWESGTLTINPPNANVTEEYISQYSNMGDATAGFSGTLVGAKNVFVRINDSIELDYTVLANEPGLRDAIIAIGAIKNLPDVLDAPGTTDAERKDNFFEVFNDLAVILERAVDDIDKIKIKLNTVQVNMEATRKVHVIDKNTLRDIISGAEDIDLTEAATKLNILRFQLEASYRVTAAVQNLSLVNFL